MATGERIAFELRVGPHDEAAFSVVRFTGREGLSDPYVFDVELVRASGEPLALEPLIGEEAVLSLRRPTGEERYAHGECVRAELASVAAGVARYRIRIAPRLARLGDVRRSRIFQGKSVPEIVGEVLDAHGVAHRATLAGSYPAREYVAQHRETDLAFVSRLLESEGIWYRFEHSAGGHELVLADEPNGYADAPAPLPLRAATGQGDGAEHVASLATAARLGTTRTTRRDFDFARPGLDLTAGAGEGELEVYEYPGGQLEGGEGRRVAAARLEGLRYGEETVHGEANAIGLVPGTRVEVEGRGAVVIVRAAYRGEQERAAGAAGVVGTACTCAFEAIPDGRPYRPPRRTPAPRIAGVQTATVVGPAGEEIHVDAHGRLKVQFHWDRDGARDDRSSAWVRAAQSWAGAGMGASFVPRVGQEVVVRFLEGDPDRPLVTGAVFNGANPVPLALPTDKTRSTLRTDSSPGSGGANELRLEDAKGAEEIYVHAQKDASAVVEADRAEAIGASAALEVTKDRARTVMGDQRLTIRAGDGASIGGNATVTVAEDRMTAVAGDHDEGVAGAQAVTVAKDRHLSTAHASAESVGAAAALTVGAAYAVTVAGVANHAIGGVRATQVAGERIEVVGGSREEVVGKNLASRAGGTAEVDVDGAASLAVDGNATDDVAGASQSTVDGLLSGLANRIELEAERVTLVVGGKRILQVERSGAVKLWGQTITVDGSTVALKGAAVKKVAGSAADSGRAVTEALRRAEARAAAAKFRLVDTAGRPVANQRFRVELPDGSVRRGTTDAQGRASVPAAREGRFKLFLPGVDPKDVSVKR